MWFDLWLSILSKINTNTELPTGSCLGSFQFYPRSTIVELCRDCTNAIILSILSKINITERVWGFGHTSKAFNSIQDQRWRRVYSHGRRRSIPFNSIQDQQLFSLNINQIDLKHTFNSIQDQQGKGLWFILIPGFLSILSKINSAAMQINLECLHWSFQFYPRSTHRLRKMV